MRGESEKGWIDPLPVAIESYTAQYRFDRVVFGQVIRFPVEFVKENGVWKTMGF
jgi:hypothetical protein